MKYWEVYAVAGATAGFALGYFIAPMPIGRVEVHTRDNGQSVLYVERYLGCDRTFVQDPDNPLEYESLDKHLGRIPNVYDRTIEKAQIEKLLAEPEQEGSQ